MGRDMITHVNRLDPEPSPKLRNIRNSNMVQGPEKVFIEGMRPLRQTDLNTIRHIVILPK